MLRLVGTKIASKERVGLMIVSAQMMFQYCIN